MAHPSAGASSAPPSPEALLDSGRVARLGDLLALWTLHDVGQRTAAGPQYYEAMARRLCAMGEAQHAFDVTREGLASFPGDRALLQLQALSLARMKAPARARDILLTLYTAGHRDGETLGLLGRVHKDMAEHADTADARRGHLADSARFYAEAYRRARAAGDSPDAWYNGINAATLRLLCGDAEGACTLAGELAGDCADAEGLHTGDEEYWRLATLAEASLLAGRRSEAEGAYRRAVATAPGRFGSFASTRRHARWILERQGTDPRSLDGLFNVPRPALVARDACNPTGAPPARQIGEVRARLEAQGPLLGFGCAFPGGDLAALAAIQELGGSVRIVLPVGPAVFESLWVADPAWRAVFRQVLGRAPEPVVLTPGRPADPAAHARYACRVAHGLALLAARESGDDLATRAGLGLAEHADQPHPEPVDDQEVHAVIFADAVSFSKLEDHQFGPFFLVFMQEIAAALEAFRARHPGEVLLVDTAGDGFWVVARTIAGGCRLAVALREAGRARNWASLGFHERLGLRVALHAGPLLRVRDPVTGADSFTGTHMCRGARIEPITDPGDIFASEALRALAVAEGHDDLRFEYVGTIQLQKESGDLALHRLVG